MDQCDLITVYTPVEILNGSSIYVKGTWILYPRGDVNNHVKNQLVWW